MNALRVRLPRLLLNPQISASASIPVSSSALTPTQTCISICISSLSSPAHRIRIPQAVNINRVHKRTMASNSTSGSASAALQEWLVIVPDFEGALDKRLKVREEHLGGLKKHPEEFLLWGGAMLDAPIQEGETPKMKGSAMLCGAETKEEVVERLKNDAYVKGEVWDWSKVQIIPFKSALRKAL